MNALTIARRELAAYFYSPIAYVVLALFLVLQGVVFVLFLHFLNSPMAPPGAVMQFFFGGTLLYWISVILAVAVLPMRLLAEERRTGTLETLLTAPVRQSEVVIGKYLAVLAFYCLLWLPELIYVALLWRYAGRPDLGPIASGYLGCFLIGAALLAWGLLASALTRNQIIAAVLGFVFAFLLLLVGIAQDFADAAWLKSTLAYVHMFKAMEDFGRGVVDSRHVVFLLSLTALGLYATGKVLELKKGTTALVSIALLAGIGVMVNYLSARHFRRADWTGAKIYSLSDKTRGILSALDKDVKVTVFMIPAGHRGANDAFDLTEQLLEQCKRYAGNHLTVEKLDVDKEREQALLLKKKYNIDDEDLRDGVVVFESGGRTKYVTKNELVEYDYRADDQKMRAYKGEGAFASALLTVTEAAQTQVCFAKGHDEADPEKYDEDGYSAFGEALKRDNYKVKTVGGLGAGVPKECDVLVVGGPHRAWEKPEAAALDAYLTNGGKALVLVGPNFDPKITRWTKSGLEEMLGNWGIKLGEALVLDPAGAVSSAAEWGTDSYTDHPLVKRLAGKITVWPAAREVRASGDAQELVRSGRASWGETNLAVFRREEPAKFDAATDVKGPVPVAAAVERKGARLVVVGTPDLIANFRLKLDVVRDYNVDFGLSAVAWLAKKAQLVAIGAKTPEHVKLQLTEAQLSSAFWLAILGLPLLGVALGGAVWWRRRA